MGKKSRTKVSTSISNYSFLPSIKPPLISTSTSNNNQTGNNKNNHNKKKKRLIERAVILISPPPESPKKKQQQKNVVKQSEKSLGKKRARSVSSEDEEEEARVVVEVEEEKDKEEEEGDNGSHLRSAFPSYGLDLDSDSDSEGEGNKKPRTKNKSSEELWNPRLLPSMGRKQSELKGLEFASYKTALYDSVKNQLDLSRTLLGWEAFRKKRVEEEEEGLEEKSNTITTTSNTLNEGSSTGNRNQEASTSQVKLDSNSFSYSSSSSSSNQRNTTTSNNPSTRPSVESEPLSEIIPLPSSLTLAQISRWPLPVSQLANSPTLPSLREVISTMASRKTKQATRSRKSLKFKIKSAYDFDGPFGRGGGGGGSKKVEERVEIRAEKGKGKQRNSSSESSSESSEGEDDLVSGSLLSRNNIPPANDLDTSLDGDSDEVEIIEDDDEGEDDDDDSDSDDSSIFSSSSSIVSGFSDEDVEDRSTFTGNTSHQIMNILNHLLNRLAEKIPKSSLPPSDFWEARIRLRNGDDIARREKALDWEDLIEVIRESGTLRKHVTDNIFLRMEAIYGEATRIPRPKSTIVPISPPPPPPPLLPGELRPKRKYVRTRPLIPREKSDPVPVRKRASRKRAISDDESNLDRQPPPAKKKRGRPSNADKQAEAQAEAQAEYGSQFTSPPLPESSTSNSLPLAEGSPPFILDSSEEEEEEDTSPYTIAPVIMNSKPYQASSNRIENLTRSLPFGGGGGGGGGGRGKSAFPFTSTSTSKVVPNTSEVEGKFEEYLDPALR